MSEKDQDKKKYKEIKKEVLNWFNNQNKKKERVTQEQKLKLRSKKGVKGFFLGLIVGIISIFCFVSAVFIFGIYKLNWNGTYSLMFMRYLHLPAVSVDGKWLLLYDFYKDFNTLKHFYAVQEKETGKMVPLTDAEIKKSTINRMLEQFFLTELAKQYDIVVTKEELDSELAKIISQAGSEEEVDKTLKSLYGWNRQDFQKNVLNFFLLRKKLEEHYRNDPEIVNQAREKAEDVLNKVLSQPENFADFAKMYSDDQATASDGGDLGNFGKGVMSKTFEDVAFALDVNEISDLVQTQEGFHIIQVYDKKLDDKGNATSVSARHILIKIKRLDDVLKELKDKSSIRYFITSNDEI